MLESLHGAAGATMMIACHEGIHAMSDLSCLGSLSAFSIEEFQFRC